MPSQVNVDNDRPGTYEDACLMLIRAHTENEPALERIYLVPDPERQEVRLIEINPETARPESSCSSSWGGLLISPSEA